MTIVLDTNIVSFIFRNDAKAQYYEERIADDIAVISFQTLEEIWFGAFKGQWGEDRMHSLDEHLQRYEVIWPNREVAEICARVRAEREREGRALRLSDCWIAATALMLGCRLATHDADFQGITGLMLLQAPPPA